MTLPRDSCRQPPLEAQQHQPELKTTASTRNLPGPPWDMRHLKLLNTPEHSQLYSATKAPASQQFQEHLHVFQGRIEKFPENRMFCKPVCNSRDSRQPSLVKRATFCALLPSPVAFATFSSCCATTENLRGAKHVRLHSWPAEDAQKGLPSHGSLRVLY